MHTNLNFAKCIIAIATFMDFYYIHSNLILYITMELNLNEVDCLLLMKNGYSIFLFLIIQVYSIPLNSQIYFTAFSKPYVHHYLSIIHQRRHLLDKFVSLNFYFSHFQWIYSFSLSFPPLYLLYLMFVVSCD